MIYLPDQGGELFERVKQQEERKRKRRERMGLLRACSQSFSFLNTKKKLLLTCER